ncbi:hypothetical protein B0T19DRAFT_293277 [Cercophora scortea]|uniref:Uncharacterized protein n=1 Tax=Cercophora scortea TaxID=314031 RepID=A0AAE0M3A5_9PEZI|nr:hypothetical protein B0T19DRAFT_293277 [Cercophora scortea]
MEGYRKFTDALIEELENRGDLPFAERCPPSFTVLEGLAGASPETRRFRQRSIPASELKDWASAPRPWMDALTPCQANLMIVEIEITGPGSDRYKIDSATYDAIFTAFKIEPSAKYFHLRMAEELFSFGVKRTRASPAVDDVLSFSLSSIPASHVIWSYEPRTCSTRVILAAAPHELSKHRHRLARHQDIMINPLYPGVAIMIEAYRHVNKRVEKCLAATSEVERRTGIDSGYDTRLRPMEPGLHAGALSHLSRVLGSAGLGVSADLWALKQCKNFLDVLVLDSLGLKTLRGIEAARQLDYDAVWVDTEEVVTILRAEVLNLITFFGVIEKRMSLQMTILYNLIAKIDSDAAIDLAQAAKRDSSSMKTVAIVTMAFLPATFFAAVFAMPLLKWDASPVIQDNFWVYLAFTLPSTALVFALWAIITQRQTIKQLSLAVGTNLRRGLHIKRRENGLDDFELR